MSSRNAFEQLHESQAHDLVHRPFCGFRFLIGASLMAKPVDPGDVAATFRVKLEPGRALLHTWFDDKNGEAIAGAYYVYVRRI